SGSISLGSKALTAGGTGTTTFSGVISDGGSSGTFTKAGSGSLTLSGTNTYIGATTVSAGTLSLGTTGSLTTASIAVNGTSTLSIGGSNQLGSGNVTVGASAIFQGDHAGGTASASNNITVNAGSTIDVTATTSLTLSGVISGSGG